MGLHCSTESNQLGLSLLFILPSFVGGESSSLKGDVGNKAPGTQRCDNNGAFKMRKQILHPQLNRIEVDNNCKQTQPSEHFISVKTQETDPNEFFIEQSLLG